MAGGKGTRFWPESRAKLPKPFLKFFGGRPLLVETVERLRPLIPSRRILVVLQQELVGPARRLLPRIPRENILGEPRGCNTAPCAVYAASQIERRDPDARLIFLPADHEIRPRTLFLKAVAAALESVDERPVLFGIRPRWANPAYGYLEVKGKRTLRNGVPFFTIRRFREKPSSAKARRFLKRGNFYWNSGMFAWRIDAFKQAVRQHLPRLYPAFRKLGGKTGKRSLARIYKAFPSVSLDYGILEKMRQVHCLLAPFDWNDLGGWPSIAEYWPSDSQKNRLRGDVLALESKGNIVKANERLIALLGVEGLIVIDTSDALLICPRSKSEEIRSVVKALEKRKAFAYL
jgi:mannose-1-phosphate guanylyltransferase